MTGLSLNHLLHDGRPGAPFMECSTFIKRKLLPIFLTNGMLPFNCGKFLLFNSAEILTGITSQMQSAKDVSDAFLSNDNKLLCVNIY